MKNELYYRFLVIFYKSKLIKRDHLLLNNYIYNNVHMFVNKVIFNNKTFYSK